ncbi:hypothetical protein [Flavobacterium phage FCL-2]|uniref:Phage tail tape measure protein domain-containing protein n=1 Tax=Flavobacterium phage FCL-2 TaxID=908819 RepID=A0A0A0YSZ0_9CAUD|nr:tail length tape measure protein [Flavobacterium phage FCL-2]AIX11884.1 hypothetical protein [Flavobacterium phage FCL-2]
MANTIRIPTEFTAVDRFSRVVEQMTRGVSRFSNTSSAAIERFNTKANNVANKMAIAGTAILAPMGVAVNDAIKFEDKMADVAKTTSLNTDESEKYGKAILEMSKNTRTSISQLQDIGVVAGTIGVAKEELEAFTKAGNEFAIALGSDFGSTEFAVEQVAKLKNLFKETRGIDIATSMTKAGSAINEVSNSAGSAKNINDFMLRIGALPDAMKPTIQQSAALGGFLEDAGLSAEIAAGGFSNLILVAGKNMTGFARQMGMTVESANKLYQTDPTKFATTFSKSLNKLKPRELAMTLNQLKIGSQETIKVVGALGSGYEKLEKVQGISNKAFADGTSISAEASKKNNTMAGKIEMAKNNMEALSIVIGTQLAPILTKIIDKIMPIITAIGDWIAKNPELTEAIAYLGMILLGAAGAIKGVTMAMELFNLVASLNPVSLIVIAIAILIALIAVVITKWDSWGAALSLFLGPVGLIIGAFKSVYDHWESIKTAFKTEGILGGLKRIGQVILDAILKPLQQLFEMIGLDSWSDSLKKLRTDMNLVTQGEMKAALESPESKQAKASAKATVNGEVNVNVSAKNGTNADATTQNKGGIPVKLSPTQGAFGYKAPFQ